MRHSDEPTLLGIVEHSTAAIICSHAGARAVSPFDRYLTDAVEIELLIGPTGAVEDTKIVKPVLLFNDAAVEAVRQWKYSPTVINGTAVSVRMLVRVTFALH